MIKIQEQFLWLVQTAILTKYICDPGDGTMKMARPMWAMEHMDDAMKVAEHIPPDVTSLEAAGSFVRWLFKEELSDDDKTIVGILLRDGI